MEETSVSNNSSTSDAKNVSANEDNNGGNSGEHNRRFIGWCQFKSKDKDKPDVLEVKPQGKDIWTTKYSKCINVSYNVDGAWSDAILPLKALNSVSTGLFSQWTEAMDGGKLNVGEAVKILTWLDKSINGHPIRRFMLVT